MEVILCCTDGRDIIISRGLFPIMHSYESTYNLHFGCGGSEIKTENAGTPNFGKRLASYGGKPAASS